MINKCHRMEEDYSNQTVAQLRSLLTAEGVSVPQGYLKKSELVEMCMNAFQKRSAVESPKASGAGRRSAGRKISLGGKSVRRETPSPEPAARRSSRGAKKAVVDLTDSPRSVSPPVEKKSFSGRPSLGTPTRKISIGPMTALPPRPSSKVTVPTSRKSWLGRVVLLSAVIALVGGLVTWYMSVSIPRTPLCNTDGSRPYTNQTCLPCPKLGQCMHGSLIACPEHHIIRGDQCMRDEKKFVNAHAMLDSIANRLVVLKGQKDCGDDVAETLYPEQLRMSLRMEFKHLSDEAFRAAFDLAIHGEKDGVIKPSNIVTTPLGLLKSTVGRKSITCRIREFIYKYFITLVIAVLIFVTFGSKIFVWRRKRNLTKTLIATIEDNTHYHDGRVQGLSVLDLRDKGMPLNHLDDKDARRTMTALLKKYPDIQCAEEIHRAGEVVYWSSHRVRAEQARERTHEISRPTTPTK
jgi:hypothetical protein